MYILSSLIGASRTGRPERDPLQEVINTVNHSFSRNSFSIVDFIGRSGELQSWGTTWDKASLEVDGRGNFKLYITAQKDQEFGPNKNRIFKSSRWDKKKLQIVNSNNELVAESHSIYEETDRNSKKTGRAFFTVPVRQLGLNEEYTFRIVNKY